MRTNDLRSFTDLINTKDVEDNCDSSEHWINLPVSEEGATLLEIAVKDRMKSFLDVLVRSGARADLVSVTSGISPVHLAAELGNMDLLKVLLSNRDDVDVNVRAESFKGCYTPLHMAAENGNVDCIKMLLGFDEIDVDAKDARGVQTPLLLSIKAKNQEAAVLLVENGACLDIKAGKQTLREYFKEAFPDIDPTRIRVKKSREVMLNLADKVFTLLKETELKDNDYPAKLGQFKTYLRFIRNLKEQQKLDLVFDLACKKGLFEHVEILLRKGASPNTATDPVLEAAFFGHYRVFKVLKRSKTNFTVTKPGTKETVLHLILRMQSSTTVRTDYQKCLDELLDARNPQVFIQMKKIINKKDDLSNTALHYGTQKWSQNTVRKLLEMGANIGMKNHWQEIPVSKIQPDTMESFLNEHCLVSEGDIVHEDFSLTFKYDFLAPDIEAFPEKYWRKEQTEELGVEKQDLIEWSGGKGDQVQQERRGVPLPETESLWYMSQSKELRHLLKHPVITSFLWYKWQRIRKYFNRNLRFTLLFTFILTWLIFKTSGPQLIDGEKQKDSAWYFSFIIASVIMLFFVIKDWLMEMKNHRRDGTEHTGKGGAGHLIIWVLLSNWIEVVFLSIPVIIIVFGSSVLQYVLSGLLVLFIVREILQMSVSIKRYFSSLENLIEIAIICLVSFLLLNTEKEGEGELRKHLAAFTIVLSWGEMIVLVGRHPKLKEYNIYVTMFLRVLKTFLLFFTWYCLFIISFGLGLFILLQDENNKEYPYFNQVWISLVKTTTMFVGELEFSDIPIDLNSKLAPLAYIFFLSFVFLIVVVLMNLLNGLAVSDTGKIRDKAEIFSYRSQVETISTFESMLLGDPFDFLSNVPAILSNIPSCSLLRQLYR